MTGPMAAGADHTCLICLAKTDTTLGFRGDAEWHMAGLLVLGLSHQEAANVYAEAVPFNDVLVAVICQGCVDRAAPNFPAPLPISDGQVPIISQVKVR